MIGGRLQRGKIWSAQVSRIGKLSTEDGRCACHPNMPRKKARDDLKYKCHDLQPSHQRTTKQSFLQYMQGAASSTYKPPQDVCWSISKDVFAQDGRMVKLTRRNWRRGAFGPVSIIIVNIQLLRLDPVFAFEAIKAGKHGVQGCLEHVVAASGTACRGRQLGCGREVFAIGEDRLKHECRPVGLRRDAWCHCCSKSGVVDLRVHRLLGR